MPGKNFISSLKKRNIEGEEAFIAIAEHKAYGFADHHELTFDILIVCNSEYQIKHGGSLAYNASEECRNFDPLQFASEYCGIPAISQSEMKGRVVCLKSAATIAQAETLRRQYRAKHADARSVCLPADLSLGEKRKFLAAFSAARGARQNLNDLFAVGSTFCDCVTSDRNIHFQRESDSLRCSTLGCAVLGITVGIVPTDPDPEVMFWAVHAAARLISGSLKSVALRHYPTFSNERGRGGGSKTFSVGVSGMWGPYENFDQTLSSCNRFEQFARLLDLSSIDLSDFSYSRYGSYQQDYLTRNTWA